MTFFLFSVGFGAILLAHAGLFGALRVGPSLRKFVVSRMGMGVGALALGLSGLAVHQLWALAYEGEMGLRQAATAAAPFGLLAPVMLHGVKTRGSLAFRGKVVILGEKKPALGFDACEK